MNKLNKIVENLWLGLSIAALFFAIYMLITKGWEEGYVFLTFPLICGIWYSFRRHMRKRMEQKPLGK